MFQKVKGVAMKDFNGNDITVTGVLSECKNFVVGCGVRKISKEKITEKPTKNGFIITVAMGDIQIFSAKNVSEVDADGYVTADLAPIQKDSSSVSYMKYRASTEKEYGDPFPGSILEGDVVKGTNQVLVAKMGDFLSPSIVDTFNQALLLGPTEKVTRARNAAFASLAKEFADSVPVTKTETAAAQHEAEVPAAGKTVEDVLPS